MDTESIFRGIAWGIWKLAGSPKPHDNRIEGIIDLPIVGDLFWVLGHRSLQSTINLSKERNPNDFPAVFNLRVFNVRIAGLITPEDIRHVTQTNFYNYEMGDLRKEVTRPFLGKGIFTTDGEFWKAQRNMSKGSFQHQKLELMVPIFIHHTQDLLNIIKEKTSNGISIDVQNLFLRFSLDCAGEILFNHPIGSLHQDIPFQRAFDYLQAETEKRVTDPSWKLIRNSKYEESLKICNDFVYEIIQKARQDQDIASRNDLLAQFMTSVDEEGNPSGLDDIFLRDMLMNFMIAGRDTTASTLTWIFYELAVNPGVQEKLYNEIIEELGEDGICSSLEKLRAMKYMKSFVNEVLRLHPPVPRVLRCAVNDDVLPSGAVIKGGTNIFYQTYTLHRLQSVWGPDAEVFDPDRWNDDRTSKIGAFEFLPFHGGPRRCLGFDMAYNEVKTCTYIILQKYKVVLDQSVPVIPETNITLVAKNGVNIFFQERN